MSKLVALCKRRGIVFQSSEIYGGVGSTYDYGPYGVEMKNNISRLWWNEMTMKHENIAGLDSAVILHPKVWEASGHLSHFSDPMVDCRECKGRFRADQIKKKRACVTCNDPIDILTDEEYDDLRLGITRYGKAPWEVENRKGYFCYKCDKWSDFKVIEVICTRCGSKNSFTETRDFNLMFQTNMGPTAEEGSEVYLRPETCQGIFLDWKIVQESARLKVPFGIAQIGKAFRNEITTGNFIFRTREFTQMEMQYFVKPGETGEWLNYWKEQRFNSYLSLGIDKDKLRWYQHPKDKLAHYAKEAWDIEYEFPFGWGELEGVHDRGDFDLKAHQEASGKDMTYFDDLEKQRYHPQIVETSAGLNRTMLAVLCDAYREDEQAGEQRIYLALDPKIAPIKASVFPLVKKDGLAEIARAVADDLRPRFPVFFDMQGSIGRRYRRMDEIGTPFGITVDYQTKEDNTVTVRWRDTLEQERIDKDQVGDYLTDKLGNM